MRCRTAPATAFIFIVLGPTLAFAEARAVKGETIKALISGGTVQLDTPIGATLPLNFAPDGIVTGSSVVLAFYLGSTTDRGRWWISGNKLCTKFNRWFDREQSCLTIRPEGRKFGWTKDGGDTGTASIISNTKRLYGSASALTGGVSAAEMVRFAEERAAAGSPKQVQIAALSAAPPKLPKPQTAAQPRPTPAPGTATLAVRDDPNAWLPLSAVKGAALPAPKQVAYSPPAPEPAPSLTNTYKVSRVTSGDVLNVRTGPDAEAYIVGSIPSNARGLVLSGICQTQWCPVSYHKLSGWVSHQFLELE